MSIRSDSWVIRLSNGQCSSKGEKLAPQELTVLGCCYGLGFVGLVRSLATGAKVGQLGERSHAAFSFGGINLGFDNWLIVAGGAGGQSDLSIFSIDPEDLEIHLLPQLHCILGFVDAVIRQFRHVTQTLKVLAELNKGRSEEHTSELQSHSFISH